MADTNGWYLKSLTIKRVYKKHIEAAVSDLMPSLEYHEAGGGHFLRLQNRFVVFLASTRKKLLKEFISTLKNNPEYAKHATFKEIDKKATRQRVAVQGTLLKFNGANF